MDERVFYSGEDLRRTHDEPAVLEALIYAVERSEDAALLCAAQPAVSSGLRILYVNTALERMTGYSAEAITGLSLRIFEGANTDAKALSRIQRALNDGAPIREELVNYRKDGSEFHVELSLMPLSEAHGGYTYWFALQRDVTERHILRRELRTTNVLLRTMTESVPQLLWTADADGRREWVSDRFAEFVGAGVQDCLGDGWVRYVHPDDREVALARLQAFRQQRKVCTAELRLRHCSGEYRWFLKQAAPRFAADGSVSKWIGSLTDISDRKVAEAALRTSEERLLLGLSLGRLVLADIDYIAEVSHLTAEAAVMYGLGTGEMTLTRKEIHRMFHPDDAAELQDRIAASYDPLGPGWFEMDHRVVWQDGRIHWVRVRKQIFFEGEGIGRKPTRATLGAFDITGLKEAEAAARESDRRFFKSAQQSPR